MPPKIVTVFDLSMLLYPQLMSRADLFYWRTLQRASLREARLVITISRSAASDIHRFYGIPNQKIRVIYPGLADHYHPASQEEICRVRAKYNLPEEYLLHVGRIDPIKNLTTVVKAFAQLRSRNVFAGKLVLVGPLYLKTPDLELVPTIKRLGLQNEVILAGMYGNIIADEDMAAVYSGARAKLFPSLNEGFGFAPLEAMACGTPVIASRAGSLPEVLGDAALLLEENNVETLAQATEHVLTSPVLHQTLRDKGLQQSRKYNWYEAARQTVDVYKEAA
jgi:glycosyltransferase involved in cell wall biosynthesis